MGGIAEKRVTTLLGNLAMLDSCSGISEHALTKEQHHYFTVDRVEHTDKHDLLPRMTVSSKSGKDTKNGNWCLQSDHQKLKLWAFIFALEELNDTADKGVESAAVMVAKMISAAAEIQVTVCTHDVKENFQKTYQEGENADHEQMQKTNSRFSNRGRLFENARAQIALFKDTCSAADIVAYFTEMEATKKIKTTLKANRVTNADDVTRVEKAYNFLVTHGLETLYEKLEWSEETGPTPLGQWTTARYLMSVVEKDPDITRYVLKVLETCIFEPDDPTSKLKKDKVLESSKKLQGIMKAVVLQYKLMRDCMASLETKPLASPSKMHSEFEVLKKFLDVTAFQEIEWISSGILQNLSWPAQMFAALCRRIVTQQLFGKFSEAEQNNPNYTKMYSSSILKELISPITNKWEEAHIQFMPKQEKVEWKDHEATESGEGGDGALTRQEAKKRAATTERDGYVKNYVLLNDDALDKQNLQDFIICKTTVADAPVNTETQAWPDISLSHDWPTQSIFLNTVSYAYLQYHGYKGTQPLWLSGLASAPQAVCWWV